MESEVLLYVERSEIRDLSFVINKRYSYIFCVCECVCVFLIME